MSWLFSQALVAEYSAAICLDGAPSVPSNGLTTQLAYLSHGKTTGFSRLSRFGMMCKPLMDAHGEALLTSYLAAFRARTSAQRGGGKGIEGERSGMWKHMARIVGEVLPRFVFVENSPLLVGRGLAVVLGDLADLGYDAQWFRLSASDLGAPHQRDRCWLVGHAVGDGWNAGWAHHREHDRRQPDAADQYANALADSGKFNVERIIASIADQKGWSGSKQRPSGSCGHGFGWWPVEPDVGRVANGLAARVDRLKALGNGQVPRVAAAAFTMLAGE